MGESNQDLCDESQWPHSSDCLGCVSCTTFNILAPIYKRLNGKNCESEFRELWFDRNESILDRLLNLKSTIICLQEFWMGNEELVRMYEKRLGVAGYATYKLARTNNRGDGLLTAVHQNHFHVLNYREVLFNDIGDRVAQLLHVELRVHSSQNQLAKMEKGALVVNTHLIFPHDSSYCFLRLKQVYKILQYIESYCLDYHLQHIPIILCGDWNGSKKGNVYKFLRSQGFVSSYDTAHHYTDNGEDSFEWVSHCNHRGNLCGVDFIWLLNPNKHRKPLKESFIEAVLGNINNLLLKVPTEGVDPLHFLETDGGYVTYCQFSQAVAELGLTGHPQDGLSNEDIKDLWHRIDTDGDGVIDLKHFARAWNPCTFLQQIKEDGEENGSRTKETRNSLTSATTIGFDVNKAMLFPPEVERGVWPENYSLSDHAQLTVEFSPVQL
uniref:EF-hand domain-containing protein n=1 Tax=Davidia involucrata TaxID=16924 RepID=A0A5B7CGB7_DAVIN